jgi:integrase/recombinase XerD
VGEAVSLRVCDVEARNTLVIERHRAKSGRSRRVYLSPDAQKHLDVYLKDRAALGAVDAEGPLFPSQRGGGFMTANAAVRLVDKLLEGAGISGASSHSLRRTHANTLRRRGTDLLIIQSQLGHSNIAITQKYLNAAPVEHAAAVSALRF